VCKFWTKSTPLTDPLSRFATPSAGSSGAMEADPRYRGSVARHRSDQSSVRLRSARCTEFFWTRISSRRSVSSRQACLLSGTFTGSVSWFSISSRHRQRRQSNSGPTEITRSSARSGSPKIIAVGVYASGGIRRNWRQLGGCNGLRLRNKTAHPERESRYAKGL
jgi:hypothetical protein